MVWLWLWLLSMLWLSMLWLLSLFGLWLLWLRLWLWLLWMSRWMQATVLLLQLPTRLPLLLLLLLFGFEPLLLVFAELFGRGAVAIALLGRLFLHSLLFCSSLHLLPHGLLPPLALQHLHHNWMSFPSTNPHQ